jgi:FixJ family two-component response regulator
MNGRELAARIQAEKPHVKVIFTSGYSADMAGRDLALNDGQTFIQKPASTHLMLETVRQMLDNLTPGRPL